MESYFKKVPTFPRDVPTIDLRRLSYTKLMAGDISESDQLFQSCKEDGFFLLDLRGSDEGHRMLEHAEFAFKLNEGLMTKANKEELEKYAYKPPGSLFGYKGVGKVKNEDGSPDNVEYYNMSQDDMVGNVAPSSHPSLISQNRPQIKKFYTHAHTILMHLMSHIDTQLRLEAGTLASLNPLDQPSGTTLRLLKAPALPPGSIPRASFYGHTDLGSMTMLFNIVGGLQVLPPNAEQIESNYKYVEPQPGCAIINLGDAMVPWSGGLLRSNMHRVAMAPGEQKNVDRYSVAYVMRPGANVSMRRLAKVETEMGVTTQEEEGETDICAKDWEKMRVAMVIEGNLKHIGVAQLKEVAA